MLYNLYPMALRSLKNLDLPMLYDHPLPNRHLLIIHCPNVVVEWLTVVLCIRNITVWNLGPGDRIFWLMFFMVFLGSSWRMPSNTLKLGHEHFLPNPFQFIIIQLSPYHRRCIVWFFKNRRRINYHVPSDFSKIMFNTFVPLTPRSSKWSVSLRLNDKRVISWNKQVILRLITINL
jgi:hypothetical protein